MKLNPYQPPAETLQTEPGSTSNKDCWREGDQLVVRAGAKLPSGSCVFCSRETKAVDSTHLTVYPSPNLERTFALLFGVAIFALALLCVVAAWPVAYQAEGWVLLALLVLAVLIINHFKQQQVEKPKITVDLPRCSWHHHTRHAGTLFWVLYISAFALSVSNYLPSERLVFTMLVLFVMFAPLKKEITAPLHVAGYFWIAGIGAKYLDQLPERDFNIPGDSRDHREQRLDV